MPRARFTSEGRGRGDPVEVRVCEAGGIEVIVAGDPTPETLPRIERFVKEYDIRFAIHNHGPEDKIWHSPLDVLKAVKSWTRAWAAASTWASARGRERMAEAIHAVGPRPFDMHMKDLADFTSKESQVAVGEGKMPVREIFESLIAIKYPGSWIWSMRFTAMIPCRA